MEIRASPLLLLWLPLPCIGSLGFRVDWVQFRLFEFKLWEFRHINASAATKLLEEAKKKMHSIYPWRERSSFHLTLTLATRSNSAFNSFWISGVGSTRESFLRIWEWSAMTGMPKIIHCDRWTHFDFDLYSRNLSKNSCWTGSLAFCIAGAMMPKLRRASSEAVRIPDKMVWVSICKRIKENSN